MIAKALERGLGRLLETWRALSLDAKVVGAIAIGNWLLLFFNHTTVAATRDEVLWHLFPGALGPLWLALCGALAIGYPLRDARDGARFSTRARATHLALVVIAFVVLPTLASIVLRETGKPYTYVHDGAIMVEEAARKLLRGQNPYVADYLDTPLFFWPMVNNPALYHFTYFPLLFLVTIPFVLAFDAAALPWDERFLYLPAFAATLAVLPRLVRRADQRLALVAAVALNPQLFPFVVEGRNDFFVLLWIFAGVALLQRERRTLACLAFALGAASKLHAALLLPFVALFLLRRHPAPRLLLREAAPALLLLVVLFLPFLVNDFGAFWDDVVRYNAGGAAWSYPISGVGFSALLLALGVIQSRQSDFPFLIFELLVAVPLAVWSLRRLWRAPSVANLLTGFALTLLGFLFVGRYFQGNYAGFVAAVATPAAFLTTSGPREGARRR